MNKLISTLKIVALALVLSFGISYVYAWTAPTSTAPGGNVSAPLNTSGTAQTKTGDITARTITAPTVCVGTDCRTAWPVPSAGGADNLGNHTATQDLNMNGKNITNTYQAFLTNITTPAGGGIVMQSPEVNSPTLFNFGGSYLLGNIRTFGGIQSPSMTYLTKIQDDGNFVVYNSAGTACWSAKYGGIGQCSGAIWPMSGYPGGAVGPAGPAGPQGPAGGGSATWISTGSCRGFYAAPFQACTFQICNSLGCATAPYQMILAAPGY